MNDEFSAAIRANMLPTVLKSPRHGHRICSIAKMREVAAL